MSQASERYEKRRLRSSNITVIISIALVLFLLGIFGLIIINAQSYADYIKEQLKLEAFFKDEQDPKLQEKQAENQKLFLDSIPAKYTFVKNYKYISKEQASAIAKKDLGIDANALFEENIYPPSIQVTLKPEFVTPKRVDSIKKVIASNPLIDEVKNDDALMVQVYDNIDRITYWLIGGAAIFLLIAIILINNSIRLKIFSKRFIIKTMQLVGAKRRFIMRPFLIESALLGFFAALVAVISLGALWYYFATKVNLAIWNDEYSYLIIIIFAIGIIIAIASTLIAAWRYLKLRTDQLY